MNYESSRFDCSGSAPKFCPVVKAWNFIHSSWIQAGERLADKGAYKTSTMLTQDRIARKKAARQTRQNALRVSQNAGDRGVPILPEIPLLDLI